MEFLQSIKTCVFKKYFKTEGRASRSEFWSFIIFYFGVIALSIFIGPYLEEISQDPFTAKSYSPSYLIWTILFTLALIVPFNNVTIRRLHDIGQSGANWMGAVGGFLILGRVLSFLGKAAGYISFIGLIIFLIILVLCLKEGEKKDNIFGKNIYKKSKKRF